MLRLALVMATLLSSAAVPLHVLGEDSLESKLSVDAVYTGEIHLPAEIYQKVLPHLQRTEEFRPGRALQALVVSNPQSVELRGVCGLHFPRGKSI